MRNQALEGFRLSPQQRRLWLLQQDSYAYSAQCVLLLEGKLKVEELKESLRSVIGRHEILRTTFHRQPGIKIPIQVIHTNGSLSWKSFDLNNLEREKRKTKTEEILQQGNYCPFDLEKGPILHSSLISWSGNQHILLITLPSLCADSWTLKNLAKEISHIYSKYLKDEKLKEEPVQYIQFSEWQNELSEEDDKLGKKYWQRQDLSASLTPTLPFERNLNGKTRFEPNVYDLRIEPAITARLEAIAGLNNVKIEQVLLACWQILLWKLTGNSDFIISTIFNGRKYEDLHETLGLLAKWLPVCCSFQGNYKFPEVLSQISEVLHNHSQWQEYFLWEDKVFTDGAINFSVGFEFQDWLEKYDVGEVSFAVEKQYVCFEPFKLKLVCVRKEEHLVTEFHYNTNIFLSETIKRLADQFQILVKSVVNRPEATVDELEVLSDRDRYKLLVEFNNTRTDYPEDTCIHHSFENQVEETPDSITVVFEDQQLTCAEVNTRANQLARYLQRLGVGPEVLVGMYLERSPDIIIALLGILKAGGAYLPLDPSLPKQGLALRLQDTQAPILLTQQSLLTSLPKQATQVICLDSNWEAIAQESDINPSSKVSGPNLAYVLFTSGSTGKPKGVCVEHRQLLNYLQSILDNLNLPISASYATVSTFAADLGNTVIFPALSTGGCLHMISQERASDPEALADYFHRYPIDCLKIVPSHLTTLLAGSLARSILPHQCLVLGGETVNWELIEQIQQRNPNCRILNHYGPTETTVGVLTYPVSLNSQSTTTPLGRPLANTQVYVLDQQLQPVPIGVPGELYISGAGLARCYLNRPELTMQRFIPNAFREVEASNFLYVSERLYRTGDLVRYLPDGNLEFLGRTDHQVKIRGFRLELGEVEALLNQHPGVRQSVVSVLGEQENKRLAAYIVPNKKQTLSVSDLHHFVREKLPEYMVPSAFVMLQALPLTSNGKVNRQALPLPEQVRPELTEAFVEPQTKMECAIATVWQELLQVKQVGIHDNFFDLGGHSLLATQVISQLRKVYQVELPLHYMFDSPTIAELTKHIEAIIKDDTGQAAPPLTSTSRDERIPLSFAQQRLWFLDQLEPETPKYNIPTALVLKGTLNFTALERSLNEIVRRHEVLRTTFAIVNGQPTQIVAPKLTLVLPIVDLQHLPQATQDIEVHRLANQEAEMAFNLAKGPLLRTTFLKLSEIEYVALFTLHHIVSDGWSTGILIDELTTLYKAFSTGEPSPLSELPIQYADFAVWQRKWLQGEVLENHLNYWKHKLGSNPPILQLPTDRSKTKTQKIRGARQAFRLSSHLSDLLKDLSNREGVTLFMILLAAFKVLLYRYSGQSDIIVGADIANRNRAETERLIGFFVNMLVLRTNLSGDPCFRDVLKQIRKVTLEAYAHQDLPFEKLVEELKVERDSGQNPLFEVVFVLHNTPRSSLDVPDITFSSLDIDRGATQFDLILSMEEQPEGIRGSWSYNTNLFEDTTITGLLNKFQTLLENIVANPEQNLSNLCLLTTEETGGYKPSDFSDASLSQKNFESLISELSQAE